MPAPHLIVVQGPRASGRTQAAIVQASGDPLALVVDESPAATSAARRLGRRYRYAVNADAVEGCLRRALREGFARVVLIRLDTERAREDVAREVLRPARVTRVRTFHPTVTEEAA